MADRPLPKTCTYDTYSWHVKKRRAVKRQRVVKPYAEVTGDERDPDDPRCTVCLEDQQRVTVRGAPDVTVCHAVADQVKAALTRVIASQSFLFKQVEGYRVGRTRGAVRSGMRTQFSNHSYGTAIDINRHHNGLYRRCNIPAEELSGKRVRRCRLVHGGAWDPSKRPRTTIAPDSVVHREFLRFWKWGGALTGSMKDFMHFSSSGR